MDQATLASMSDKDIIEHVRVLIDAVMTEEDPELEESLGQVLRSNMSNDRKLARSGRMILPEMIFVQKLEVIMEVLSQGIPNGRAQMELAFAMRMHALYEKANQETAASILLQGVQGFTPPRRG